MEAHVLEKIRSRCGFSDGLCLSSNGNSGGIGLWWNNMDVSVVSFSAHHIHGVVLDDNKNPWWHAVGIYGWPETSNKYLTWQLIRQIKQQCGEPVLFFGDFNEIVSVNEKAGGVPRCERLMDAFRETMDDCEVKDLGFKGCCFTWQRGNSPSTLIQERLDRMLANEGWCDIYPSWEVLHLPRYRSDHAPLLLKTGVNDSFRRGSKLFKFEALWLSKEECKNVVEAAWVESVGEGLTLRLERVSQHLSTWATHTFGNLKKRKKEAFSRLSNLQQQMPDAAILDQCRVVSRDLDEIHRLEESYWHARARTNEIRDGDKNTKYFHHKASQRKRRNTIHGLLDENGVWKKGREEIRAVVEGYFAGLFASDNPERMEEALEGIHPCVSASMNDGLVRVPSGEEVREALFAMHPNKAPGIDGLHALFFQKFWHILGPDIISFV